MLTYVFKMLHILGVVLFLGNIITAAIWKTFADQTRRPEVVAFSQRLIVATDIVFTLGGVVLILIGGFGIVQVAGLDIASTLRLQHGLALCGISGLIWVLILIPIEYWQLRMPNEFAAKFLSAFGALTAGGSSGASSRPCCRCSISM
jgi:uncharacterized membrane protein